MAHRPDSDRERDLERRERELAEREGHAHGGRTPERRHGTGLATGAAVLGIIALLAVVLTIGGLFFLALPLGIVAIVMAVVARRRVDDGTADPRGRGRATTGLVTGVIATFLSALVALLIAIGIALLSEVDFDALPDDIEEQIPDELIDDVEREAERIGE